MSKTDLRERRAALTGEMPASRRVALFGLLRPNELEMLIRREAFLRDRERMLAHVRAGSGDNTRIQALSEAAGYAKGTLGGVLSESAVERQMRYNCRVLTSCMFMAGLKPDPVLAEHYDEARGPRSAEAEAA